MADTESDDTPPQAGASDRFDEISGLVARRATEYVELWESTMAKVAASDYHSDDLVDDWFTWWGKWVRDSTAIAALTWRTYEAGTPASHDASAAREH
jgi:hypothetical protein